MGIGWLSSSGVGWSVGFEEDEWDLVLGFVLIIFEVFVVGCDLWLEVCLFVGVGDLGMY